MSTDVPWTNPEFDQLLEQKIGADWVREFEAKWGDSWGAQCAEELSGELGSGWADNPEHATDVLAGLVEVGAVGEPEAAGEEPDPDSIVDIDLSQYEWLNTLAEADSFESWLTRIGVPATDAAAIATAEGARTEETNP